jgi:hypothetical protein
MFSTIDQVNYLYLGQCEYCYKHQGRRDDSFTKSPCTKSLNFLTISLTKGMCINDDKEGLVVVDDDIGTAFNANCARWDDDNFWDNVNIVINTKAGANCLTSPMGDHDFSGHALEFANAVNFTRSAGAMACLAFLLGCAALFFNKTNASISRYCHAGFVIFILITFILNVATFGGIGGGTNPIQNYENWNYILGNAGWPEAFPNGYGTGGQCAIPAGAVSSCRRGLNDLVIHIYMLSIDQSIDLTIYLLSISIHLFRIIYV